MINGKHGHGIHVSGHSTIKGANKLTENTPNAPKFISQIVCPIWDLDEKRLHWASEVRGCCHCLFPSLRVLSIELTIYKLPSLRKNKIAKAFCFYYCQRLRDQSGTPGYTGSDIRIPEHTIWFIQFNTCIFHKNWNYNVQRYRKSLDYSIPT